MDNENFRSRRRLEKKRKEERKRKLLGLVRKNGGASSGELYKMMGPSSGRAVRRYLLELRREGRIRRRLSGEGFRGKTFFWEVEK